MKKAYEKAFLEIYKIDVKTMNEINPVSCSTCDWYDPDCRNDTPILPIF